MFHATVSQKSTQGMAAGQVHETLSGYASHRLMQPRVSWRNKSSDQPPSDSLWWRWRYGVELQSWAVGTLDQPAEPACPDDQAEGCKQQSGTVVNSLLRGLCLGLILKACDILGVLRSAETQVSATAVRSSAIAPRWLKASSHCFRRF